MLTVDLVMDVFSGVSVNSSRLSSALVRSAVALVALLQMDHFIHISRQNISCFVGRLC